MISRRRACSLLQLAVAAHQPHCADLLALRLVSDRELPSNAVEQLLHSRCLSHSFAGPSSRMDPMHASPVPAGCTSSHRALLSMSVPSHAAAAHLLAAMPHARALSSSAAALDSQQKPPRRGKPDVVSSIWGVPKAHAPPTTPAAAPASAPQSEPRASSTPHAPEAASATDLATFFSLAPGMRHIPMLQRLSSCTTTEQLLEALQEQPQGQHGPQQLEQGRGQRQQQQGGAGAPGGADAASAVGLAGASEEVEVLLFAVDKAVACAKSRPGRDAAAAQDPFFNTVAPPPQTTASTPTPTSESASTPAPSPVSGSPTPRQALMTLLGERYMRLLPTLEPTVAVKLLHSFAVLGHNPAGDAQGLLDLSTHCHKVLKALEAESADHTANLMWALGELSVLESVLLGESAWGKGKRAVDVTLYYAAASALHNRVGSMQSRSLSKLLQGFASARCSSYPLFDSVVRAAAKKLTEFDSASLSNLMQCLNKLEFTDHSFQLQVAERVRLTMKRLKTHHVVSLVKSFAAAMFTQNEFYEAASQQLQLSMAELSPSEVTSVAWSFAVRDMQDIMLFKALAFRGTQVLHKLKPRELSTLVWSFARLGLLPPKPLLVATAKAATSGINAWPMRNMSNLVWAYARMGYYNKPLFEAVADRAVLMLQDPAGRIVELRSDGVEVYHDDSGHRIERLPGFNQQGEVTERVYLKSPLPHLEHIVRTRRPLDPKLQQYVPQNLSDIAWAFAESKHRDPRLFELIARRAVTDMQRKNPAFGKTTAVDLAFAFATADHYDRALFCEVEAYAWPVVADFGPAYISELMWAMAQLKHQPDPGFVKEVCDTVWNKWDRVTQDNNWMAKTVWSLLQLNLAVKAVSNTHPLMIAFQEASQALAAGEGPLLRQHGGGSSSGVGSSTGGTEALMRQQEEARAQQALRGVPQEGLSGA